MIGREQTEKYWKNGATQRGRDREKEGERGKREEGGGRERVGIESERRERGGVGGDEDGNGKGGGGWAVEGWGGGGGGSVTDRQTPHRADNSGIELNSALTFSVGLLSSPHSQHLF